MALTLRQRKTAAQRRYRRKHPYRRRVTILGVSVYVDWLRRME
jgi:hypothetical protein